MPTSLAKRRDAFAGIEGYLNQLPNGLDDIKIPSDDDLKAEQEIFIINLQISFLNDLEEEKALTADWYVELKQKLNIKADLKNGIVSKYVKPNNGDGLTIPMYLRDARLQSVNQQIQNGFEDWAIMGLSYFQIAEEMIRNSSRSDIPKTELIEKIRQDAVVFLSEIATNPYPQEFAHQTIKLIIIPQLMNDLNMSKKNVKKNITQLKDFGNMEESPCALVTLSRSADISNQKKTFAQVDVPVCQLTKEQKIDYIKILLFTDKENEIPEYLNEFKQQILKDYPEGITQNTLPEWYSLRSTTETQLMIQKYALKLLSEEGCVIPTQMLDLLPGLRNSGEEGIYELKQNAWPKKLNQSFHAGSIGQDIKTSQAENVRLAVQNIIAFREAQGGKLKKVRINSWISPGLPWLTFGIASRNERRLYNIQKAAAEEINGNFEKYGFKVVYANTPLDFTRIFGIWNGREVENDIWDDAKEKIITFLQTNINSGDDNSDESTKLLNSNIDLDAKIDTLTYQYPDGISIEEAKTALKTLGRFSDDNNIDINDNYAILFQHMVELRRLNHLFTWDRWTPNLQNNGQRAAKFTQMQSLINEMEGTAVQSALITGCKSGKDREGEKDTMVMMDVVARQITGFSTRLSRIGNVAYSVLYDIGRNIAHAAQIAIRAGLQGGTEGAKGLKNDGYMVPSWYRDIYEDVVRSSANSNKNVKTQFGLLNDTLKTKRNEIRNDIINNSPLKDQLTKSRAEVNLAAQKFSVELVDEMDRRRCLSDEDKLRPSELNELENEYGIKNQKPGNKSEKWTDLSKTRDYDVDSSSDILLAFLPGDELQNTEQVAEMMADNINNKNIINETIFEEETKKQEPASQNTALSQIKNEPVVTTQNVQPEQEVVSYTVS